MSLIQARAAVRCAARGVGARALGAAAETGELPGAGVGAGASAMSAAGAAISAEVSAVRAEISETALDPEAAAARVRRLVYRARQRGFLELDLLVGDWAATHAGVLDAATLDAAERLLDEAGSGRRGSAGGGEGAVCPCRLRFVWASLGAHCPRRRPSRAGARSLRAPLLPSSSLPAPQENPDVFAWITGQLPAPPHVEANAAFASLRDTTVGRVRGLGVRSRPGLPWRRGWGDGPGKA